MKLFPRVGQYRLLLHFLRNRWPQALVAFLLDLAASLCLVASSLLLAQVVAVIFGFRSVRGSLLGLHVLDAAELLTGFGGVALARFVFDWARWRLQGALAEDFAHELRLTIFHHLLAADHRHIQQQGAGRYLLRFSGDLSSVQQLLARGVLQCASDCILLGLGLALIVTVDSQLGGWIAAALLGAAAVSAVLKKRMGRVDARRRGKKSGLLSFVSTSLWHLTSIQALNRSTRVRQQFDRKANSVRTWGHRYQQMTALQKALPPFFTHLLLLLVLAWGWLSGVSGGGLFAVVLVLTSWRSPLSRLLRVGWVWEKGALSLHKIETLLATPNNPSGLQVVASRSCQTLELRNVHLHLNGRPVLHNFSVALTTGQFQRLQMPTGGGKTTLTKLLAGLYQPDSGHLEWDKQPATQLELRSQRQQVALVSSAFPLTGSTLVDALSASGQASALASAEQALRRFQQRFPNALGGLDGSLPLLGGHALSDGQQRLLQCLRAVLANKPFLILDDPFVGLDPAVASSLYQYVREHSAHKGVLLLETHPLHVETTP